MRSTPRTARGELSIGGRCAAILTGTKARYCVRFVRRVYGLKCCRSDVGRQAQRPRVGCPQRRGRGAHLFAPEFDRFNNASGVGLGRHDAVP